MGKPCQLNDVLATSILSERLSRAPNLTAENEALHSLAVSLGGSPCHALQHMLDCALRLCDAGTVGISLLEQNDDATVFRWIALSGKLASHVGGYTPRDHSPCGVTLDRKSPQLFVRPGRYFSYFAPVEPPIIEGLVVPFYRGAIPWGTIWVVSHDPKIEFDQEDVRVMKSLSGFTTAILLAMGYSAEGHPASARLFA